MSLIAKLINRISFLCIFSFSLSFDGVVLWFVVTGDDGGHLLIFTATLPQMHKHIHIQLQTHTHTNTHHSCCALSWLATFRAYVPHGAISSLCSVWKLLISTLSPISAPGSVMARAHCGHITLLDDRTTCFHPVMSQRLWPAIRHKAHQNRLFFSSDCFLFETKFHCRHKLKTKICLDVFVKVYSEILWLIYSIYRYQSSWT